MLTRTDRRRLPVLFAAIAALAVAGTVLGLLFSEVDAHTPDDGPHGPEHTHFYLWRTTMTVGFVEIPAPILGYDTRANLASDRTQHQREVQLPALVPARQTSLRPRLSIRPWTGLCIWGPRLLQC